jgi:hypothetical protein
MGELGLCYYWYFLPLFSHAQSMGGRILQLALKLAGLFTLATGCVTVDVEELEIEIEHPDGEGGDSDGDGLSDEVEGNLGTNPLDTDSDGDGLSDGHEVSEGTDPLDEYDPIERSCSLLADPEIGIWTSSFDAETSCTCSSSQPECHAIYIGRVDAIDVNSATLSFQKSSGDAPSVDATYWLVESEEDSPSCTELASSTVRTSGTWDSDDPSLTLEDVDIWLSEEDLAAATPGAQQKLFLITGGSDGASSKTWFQREALVFTMECD